MGTHGVADPEGSPSALVTAAMSQPRARHLNSAQRARLQRAARDAALLYPDNSDLQQCAIDAALDYLNDSADLDADGAKWHRIRQEETTWCPGTTAGSDGGRRQSDFRTPGG